MSSNRCNKIYPTGRNETCWQPHEEFFSASNFPISYGRDSATIPIHLKRIFSVFRRKVHGCYAGNWRGALQEWRACALVSRWNSWGRPRRSGPWNNSGSEIPASEGDRRHSTGSETVLHQPVSVLKRQCCLIIMVMIIKRWNIRASPTRTFFSQSQWNPTVRSVPFSPLWSNAWLEPPATCVRCPIYSKDSRSLYSVSILS